jgi:predicted alpha/beta hydrolase
MLITPQMKQGLKVTASDGFPIAVTSFSPKKPNGRVVLINSATGVKQHYYSDFAEWLCEKGFRVFTYDYRGIGASKTQSLKGFHATMDDWGSKDYHSVLKYLFMAFPESQFVVVGHSVGGQVIGMSPLSENLDAVVMVGAQTPYWKDFAAKGKLFAFWHVIVPFFTTIFGYFPASKLRLFEDLPAGVARQWARWAKSENYLFDEITGMKERFSAPASHALMISFADDSLAPKTAVVKLMRYFKNLKWTHMHVNPEDILQKEIGHFGFFRKKLAFAFWGEVLNWINKPLQMKENRAA